MLAAYPEQEETVVLHKCAGESVACAGVTSALSVRPSELMHGDPAAGTVKDPTLIEQS